MEINLYSICHKTARIILLQIFNVAVMFRSCRLVYSSTATIESMCYKPGTMSGRVAGHPAAAAAASRDVMDPNNTSLAALTRFPGMENVT